MKIAQVAKKAKPLLSKRLKPKARKGLVISESNLKDLKAKKGGAILAEKEPAIQKSSRKRVSKRHSLLVECNEASEQKLSTPSASNGEAARNKEPSPGKKKKLPGKRVLNRQTKDDNVEGLVISESNIKDSKAKKKGVIQAEKKTVKEAEKEPAIQKSLRKRVSKRRSQLGESNEASEQKLSTPSASDGEAACNIEPSPRKKKKLSGKRVLNRQTNEDIIEAEKPVKTVKSKKKGSNKKKSKKQGSQNVPVIQKDVSKDSRLENLQEAAEAVLTLAGKKFRVKSKKQLFAEDAQPVLLQINTFRVPKTPPRILRINLPHSIYEKTADICLILADPIKGRKRDTEQDAIVEEYKEMLENKGVKNIKEVIPFNYLRTQFGPFEMRRRFASSYDVFLCDSRFVGHATHFLGNQFFKDRCLTPIRVVKDGEREFIDDLKSAIDFSLHKTWMRVHAKGSTFSVVVGHSKLTSEQIAANVLAVLNDLQVSFPGGLDSIKMALLKGHESNPVPVFVSLKPHNEAPVPIVKSIYKRHGQPATGELSTFPGREVTVFPSGRIDIRNKMTPEDKEYEKIMGLEPRWKRLQNKLTGNDDEGGPQEEEINEHEDKDLKMEGLEDGEQDDEGQDDEGLEDGEQDDEEQDDEEQDDEEQDDEEQDDEGQDDEEQDDEEQDDEEQDDEGQDDE